MEFAREPSEPGVPRVEGTSGCTTCQRAAGVVERWRAQRAVARARAAAKRARATPHRLPPQAIPRHGPKDLIFPVRSQSPDVQRTSSKDRGAASGIPSSSPPIPAPVGLASPSSSTNPVMPTGARNKRDTRSLGRPFPATTSAVVAPPGDDDFAQVHRAPAESATTKRSRASIRPGVPTLPPDNANQARAQRAPQGAYVTLFAHSAPPPPSSLSLARSSGLPALRRRTAPPTAASPFVHRNVGGGPVGSAGGRAGTEARRGGDGGVSPLPPGAEMQGSNGKRGVSKHGGSLATAVAPGPAGWRPPTAPTTESERDEGETAEEDEEEEEGGGATTAAEVPAVHGPCEERVEQAMRMGRTAAGMLMRDLHAAVARAEAAEQRADELQGALDMERARAEQLRATLREEIDAAEDDRIELELARGAVERISRDLYRLRQQVGAPEPPPLSLSPFGRSDTSLGPPARRRSPAPSSALSLPSSPSRTVSESAGSVARLSPEFASSDGGVDDERRVRAWLASES